MLDDITSSRRCPCNLKLLESKVNKAISQHATRVSRLHSDELQVQVQDSEASRLLMHFDPAPTQCPDNHWLTSGQPLTLSSHADRILGVRSSWCWWDTRRVAGSTSWVVYNRLLTKRSFKSVCAVIALRNFDSVSTDLYQEGDSRSRSPRPGLD